MRWRPTARTRCASPATARSWSRRRRSARAEGWRDGWCATALDDGFAAIDVAGADAASALAQGTSADLAAGSPSAAVLFAGLTCLLARTGDGFRLHLEAPWLEALLTWLDGA